MSDTSKVLSAHQLAMGDRGRIVIPADVRSRAGLVAGTPLILLETNDGFELYSREQLSDKVAADLRGSDLVGELLAERHREAARENAETDALASDGEAADEPDAA
ncbi:MAG: AbrB/MazE/SpoVT family DNA-binding domain-containing protein [Acidimicrobiales bacterium]|nr:AbrB/MazE/SpoVT family DNA-binding domain-containing protein [Acidimicrobiales bacterium]MYG87700.1 AbrB/MazE/SpoVT family DNA-binding domain-containing protein [Acidimicrobiales bacterium]MYI28951.1 AbrB/MazE/SpoVT family DNA-binding domain-containing protein [Acidimicrobiales bacterium]